MRIHRLVSDLFETSSVYEEPRQTHAFRVILHSGASWNPAELFLALLTTNCGYTWDVVLDSKAWLNVDWGSQDVWPVAADLWVEDRSFWVVSLPLFASDVRRGSILDFHKIKDKTNSNFLRSKEKHPTWSYGSTPGGESITLLIEFVSPYPYSLSTSFYLVKTKSLYAIRILRLWALVRLLRISDYIRGGLAWWTHPRKDPSLPQYVAPLKEPRPHCIIRRYPLAPLIERQFARTNFHFSIYR